MLRPSPSSSRPGAPSGAPPGPAGMISAGPGPSDWRHPLVQAAVIVATAAWWAWAVPAASAPTPAPAMPAPRSASAPSPRVAGPAPAPAPAWDASRPRAVARRDPASRRHAAPQVQAQSQVQVQVQVGRASFYSPRLAGRLMASGRRFDPGQPVAASRTLPLGTTARVTNLETGRSAIVRIEDRGPVPRDRVVDLAPAVARQIGLDRGEGLAPVVVEPLSMPASVPEGSPSR